MSGEWAALPSGVTIRRYRAEDYDQVWQLHREGVLATTPQYSDAVAGYEDDLYHLEQTYLGAGCSFWVAETPVGLIGMTAICRVDERTARLRRVRVTEAWRRKGIARALLKTAEAFCRACGYRCIVLDTTEQQVAAHRLYERDGFVGTGQRSLGDFTVFDYAKDLA